MKSTKFDIKAPRTLFLFGGLVYLQKQMIACFVIIKSIGSFNMFSYSIQTWKQGFSMNPNIIQLPHNPLLV